MIPTTVLSWDADCDDITTGTALHNGTAMRPGQNMMFLDYVLEM